MEPTAARGACGPIRHRVDVSASRTNHAQHDGQRCCSLLQRLLRDVAAFARQQQQRQRQKRPSERRLDGSAADAALWIEAVARVCDTRIEQLQQPASALMYEAERAPLPARPQDVVAEAMVQELLVSLAAIRLAETETLVLNEVENVESLRWLRMTLQHEEAVLRRAVRDGAGEETQLMELQRLLRDAFVQELAQARAQGLADSLYSETSLQFAWETIQDQKREIVRLRVENEQLKSTERVSTSRSPEPLETIQQLQLQLSSHPDTRLRLLEAQLSQLEVAMSQPERRTQPDSVATLSSSRDVLDDESLRGSVLLPSHLVAVDHASPRECLQCRRHVRTYVECQSEIKQLRAQAIADEDALVRAEQAHTHMKREHTTLTSALIAAKQKQDELRQLVVEVTDDKLRIQSMSESQKREHSQHVASLQHQLRELMQARDRSTLEQLNAQVCHEAIENELSRLKIDHEKALKERDALAKCVEQLDRQVNDARDEVAVEKAQVAEALHALAVGDKELLAAKKTLEEMLQQATLHEAAVERLERVQQQLKESHAAASTQIRLLQEQLQQEAMAAAKSEAAATTQLKRVAELTGELSSRDEQIRGLVDDAARQQVARQRVEQQMRSSRNTQQRLEQHAAELEGRLNQSEEARSLLQHAVDEALTRVVALEDKTKTSTQELQRLYEECERLELSLADARAKSSSLQTQLLDHQRTDAEKTDAMTLAKSKLDSVEAAANAQIGSLANELSETKTTILMWMSKYHTAVNASEKLQEQLAMVQDEMANAACQHGQSMDHFRQNVCALAEDKERTLQELTSTMEEKRMLASENESLSDANVRLQSQVDQLSRRLSCVSEELQAAITEKEQLALRIADRLVEIGQLQAEKSVLATELETAKRLSEVLLKEKETVSEKVSQEQQTKLQEPNISAIHMLSIHQDLATIAFEKILASLGHIDGRLEHVSRRLQTASELKKGAVLMPLISAPSPITWPSPRMLEAHASVETGASALRVEERRGFASSLSTYPNHGAEAKDAHEHASTSPAQGALDSSFLSESLTMSTSQSVEHRDVGSSRLQLPREFVHIGSQVHILVRTVGVQTDTDMTAMPRGSVGSAEHQRGRDVGNALTPPVVDKVDESLLPERVDASTVESSVPCDVDLGRKSEREWKRREEDATYSILEASSTTSRDSHVVSIGDAVATPSNVLEVFECVATTADRQPISCLVPSLDALSPQGQLRDIAIAESEQDAVEIKRSLTMRATGDDDIAQADFCSQTEAQPSASLPLTAALVGLSSFNDFAMDEWLRLETSVVSLNERLCHVVQKSILAVDTHRGRKRSRPLQANTAVQTVAVMRDILSPVSLEELSLLEEERRKNRDASHSMISPKSCPLRPNSELDHADDPQPIARDHGSSGPFDQDAARSSAQEPIDTIAVVSRACHDGHDTNTSSLWARFVTKVQRQSSHRCLMVIFRTHRHLAFCRVQIRDRFTVLVVKLLAATTARAWRTLASAATRRMVVKRNALLLGMREHRALASWSRMLRQLVPQRRNPLRMLVRGLWKKCHTHRQDPIERRWHRLGGRLAFFHFQRGLRRLTLQCLCLHQRHARQRSLQIHFAAWAAQCRASRNQKFGVREQPVMTCRAAKDLSPDLQAAMRECVTLLQRCYTEQTTTKHHHSEETQDTMTENTNAKDWMRTVDLNQLIRLLLEGSRQAGEWKEAMDKKLHEISVREGQLHRLETHCTKLQQIVATYQQLRQGPPPGASLGPAQHDAQGDDRWWLAPDHPIQSVAVGDPRVFCGLEQERRRLTQGNIAMLERVIVQLQDAKAARIKLHDRLSRTARSLVNAQRFCRGVCIENVLLRAFYRWRLDTLRGGWRRVD